MGAGRFVYLYDVGIDVVSTFFRSKLHSGVVPCKGNTIIQRLHSQE